MTELMTYAGNKHFLILTDSLREIKISSFGLLLNITWNWIASNTLIDSELICSIVDAVNDPYIRKHPKVFEKHEYDFSKDQTGNFGWVEKNDDALHSSKELVDDWLEKLFEFGYKTR